MRSVVKALGREPAPVVAVIRLNGPIGDSAGVGRGLTLDGVATLLERGFKQRNLSAVALSINSPGGSAVQSALIAARIRSLAAEHNVPVIAFVQDVAASGGYWLACAADEIFAHEASIVGSIGVVAAGFGFQSLMERLGVERRLYTSGEHKAQLDPFKPENPAEVARLQTLLADMHGIFNRMVRERRGARLKADDEFLFSGEFWTGRRGMELGLIDGFGEIRTVMRARYGERVRLRTIQLRQPLLRRLAWRRRMTTAVGPDDLHALIGSAAAALEERALWGRYGL